jgi:hypothetical protein
VREGRRHRLHRHPPPLIHGRRPSSLSLSLLPLSPSSPFAVSCCNLQARACDMMVRTKRRRRRQGGEGIYSVGCWAGNKCLISQCLAREAATIHRSPLYRGVIPLNFHLGAVTSWLRAWGPLRRGPGWLFQGAHARRATPKPSRNKPAQLLTAPKGESREGEGDGGGEAMEGARPGRGGLGG